MNGRRLLTRTQCALVVVTTLAGGCRPPDDVDAPVRAKVARNVPAPQGATPSPAPDSPGETPPPDAAPLPVSSDPHAPAPSPGQKPSVYEHLAGGIYVARCPSCGAVQPPASRKCATCGQALSPWRQEQVCVVCSGSGECERCGDDRVCTDCDGLGVCPFCAGSGKLGAGEKCFECGGNGKCAPCQGDGRRESANNDFGPRETVLPGICPVCYDGSGLCPDCGTLTKDTAGGKCLTCQGLGVCAECGGTGLCPYDAADGYCVACRGGGREVADSDPAKPSARVWTLRTGAKAPVVGRVLARPDPNVHVQTASGPTVTRSAFTRAQLSPLSYYLALRDWTPETDGKGRMELGTIALSSHFWPVATQDFRRAMTADPTLASEAAAQLRDVTERRTVDWLEAAENAKKAGDRERATLLLNMVHFAARGSPHAMRGDVLLLRIQQELDEETKGLDDAARAQIETETKARVERVAAGARLRLDRARRLLKEAQQRPASDPGIEGLLSRADEAAAAAQRIVLREAYRSPASKVPWPVKPETLTREGRLVRAEVAVHHATREIAGGRFEFGARLARRAASFDADSSQAAKLLEQAELGIARSGVLRGSPAPIPK